MRKRKCVSVFKPASLSDGFLTEKKTRELELESSRVHVLFILLIWFTKCNIEIKLTSPVSPLKMQKKKNTWKVYTFL